MTVPRDGWEPDEREVLALEGLGDELDAVRARHAGDPSLELLLAAREHALPEDLQARAGEHLTRSAWSRALVDGIEAAESPLAPEDAARLLAKIQAAAPRAAAPAAHRWRWGFALAAAAAVVAVAGSIWMRSPAPPVYQLSLDKPELKISPAALAWRGPRGDNALLTDLKPAFDAFRADDFRRADLEFAALSPKYPSATEIFLYQGVARLFINDVPGATSSLATAERVADSSLAWDVAWYRAIAEERAGHVAAARARLGGLCAGLDARAQTACEALKRLPR